MNTKTSLPPVHDLMNLAGQRVLVTGIQPVVHREQSEPVTLAAARRGGQADVDTCRFLVLSGLREASAAGLRRAAEPSTIGRSTGGDDH